MKPFTINIPIYNEEKILVQNTEKVIGYLDGLGTEYEIIMVSNGSTDRSCELGNKLQEKYPQVRFFHLPERGVGRAFKKAVQEAKYPHIISLDMDLAVDLAFVKEANVLLDEYDIVIGSKIAGTQTRHMIRKIGSNVYIYFAKLFLGVALHDFSIGAKGFSKEFVLDNLDCVDDYTSYVLNLVYWAIRKGKKIIEVPVNCYDTRRSKFNLLLEAFYRFTMLFKLALSAYFLRTSQVKG